MSSRLAWGTKTQGRRREGERGRVRGPCDSVSLRAVGRHDECLLGAGFYDGIYLCPFPFCSADSSRASPKSQPGLVC
jgi:hypothetical protein